MSAVLVVAELFNGRPLQTTLQTVGAGLALAGDIGADLDVVVFAKEPAAARELAALAGVREILHVPQDVEADQQVGFLAKLARDDDYRLILAALTPDTMALGPRLAMDLGYGLASNVMTLTAVDGTVVARRHGYADRLAIDQSFDGLPGAVLLLGLGSWAVPDGGGMAPIRVLAPPVGEAAARSRHVLFEPAETEGAIARAPVVLSVGRGIGDIGRVPLFEELARKLGAELGASRPLVDAGWVAKSRMVGVSGFTVEPRIYLAFGISGSTQHLAGIGQGTTIVAVNTDPEAPIFEVARYGAAVDTIELATALLELLGSGSG